MVEGLKRVVGGLCGGAAGITRPTLPPPKKVDKTMSRVGVTHTIILPLLSLVLSNSLFFFLTLSRKMSSARDASEQKCKHPEKDVEDLFFFF